MVGDVRSVSKLVDIEDGLKVENPSIVVEILLSFVSWILQT